MVLKNTNWVCRDAIVLSFSESWERSNEYSLFIPVEKQGKKGLEQI